LLSIIASYLPYQDVAISLQTKKTRLVFEENSGLASTIPAERIAEAVTAAIHSRAPAPTSPPPEPQTAPST
jgi:hypothetical protein